MSHYVMVIDVLSNVSFVGPFDTETGAHGYCDTLNPDFDTTVLTESEMEANIKEFGPAPIERPLQ